MPTLSSADGTAIGYEQTGAGPAVVLVDGAMCHRAGGPMRPLAAALAGDFTVYTYDRRGRGASGDTLPYAVEREVEDLRAVLDAAGGGARVCGISSGAALALTAAAAGAPITRLALYEPPFVSRPDPGRYRRDLDAALAAGDRGEAVALFLRLVGAPPPAVEAMRDNPAAQAIAPTLAYDDEILGDSRVPTGRAATVTIPTRVLAGTASPPMLLDAARATAAALPDGGYQELAGQTHDVDPTVLAAALTPFFAG